MCATNQTSAWWKESRQATIHKPARNRQHKLPGVVIGDQQNVVAKLNTRLLLARIKRGRPPFGFLGTRHSAAATQIKVSGSTNFHLILRR